MESLRKRLQITYPYTTIEDRQQAQTLTSIHTVTILLMLMIGGAIAFSWESLINREVLLIGFATFILMTGLSIVIANTGRLRAASYLPIIMAMLATLLLLSGIGLFAPYLMATAIPILLASTLLKRRGVMIVTVSMVVGVGAVGIIQRYILLQPLSFYDTIIPTGVLLTFFGMLLWLFSGEFNQLFREVYRLENQLGAILNLNTKIFDPQKSRHQLLRDFGLYLQQTYDFQQVLIYLRDENNPGVVTLRSGIGLAAQRAMAQGRTVSTRSRGPLGTAIHEKRATIIRSSDLAHLRTELFSGSNAQLILPMYYGEDDLLGLIDLQSAEENIFTEDVVNLLQSLVWQFGIVLQTYAQQRQIDHQQEELDQLYVHIEKTSTEIQGLRQQASGAIWERFFRERGTDILGYDINADMEAPTAGQDITESMETTLKAGAVDVRRSDTGYILTLPVFLRGQVLGVMEFTINQAGDLPTRAVDLASTIAERLSLALDNARLVEQTQLTAQREQQVGVITQRLQRTLNMDDLLALAANEFNQALGSQTTHIQLQLIDDEPAQPTASNGKNGGGAS
jgi:GAF domain-containing protein